MCPTCKLVEVYKSEAGCVYQCNNQNCLILNFAGETISYKIYQFFDLKRAVDKINITDLLNCTDNASDVSIIAPFSSSKVYVLNICELLSFKELLAGTKVMLELNSILYEKVYNMAY